MAEYAVTITAPETAELQEGTPDSRPLGPQEVSGRTLASLISAGTELASAYTGSSFPANVGYAAVFEVESVGAEVTRVRPGDRVLCMGPHRSYQRTAEASLVPLPPSLDPLQATFARLMSVSMSTLVTTTARPGDRVVVMGLGLVGHLASRIFQACGYRVTAVDPDDRRRSWIADAGLEAVLPAAPAADSELAGQVALVLECSGREEPALAGCWLVGKRGEVVLVGTPWRRTSDATAHALLHAVFHHYVVLRSGWEWELPVQPTDFRPGSIMADLATALRWLEEGRITVNGLYEAASPRDCQAVYQRLLHNQVNRLGVVFDWRSLI